MTEQERMKQGYVWQDIDDENMRSAGSHKSTGKRIQQYATGRYGRKRSTLFHDIFGKVGKNVWITPPLTT